MATIDTLQIPFMVNAPGVATQRGSLNSNPYFQYFGTPQTYQPLQSYEAIDQTMRTFPEALKGRSTFLERTFTLLALTQNAFLTSVILPIKYSNDIHYTWSQWIFHPYLPERVPHLGVVRFVKSQTQTKTKALTRFGLGMTLEHGFMETELGRQTYIMEVRQITQAINEGLQAEALYALMNSQAWELNRLRQLQGSTGNTLYTQHVDAIIQRELDTWACMQQNRHAWYTMNDYVARAIETYSQGGFNAWIIDIRVDSFRKRVAEDQTTFAIHGPGFLESLQQGAQHYQVDPNGNVIYATRSFLTGETPVNPLESVAQIGEYFRCADVPDTDFDDYDSSARTQKFYDEDNDVMKDITLRQKLHHCGRFKPDGTLMTFKDLRVKADLGDDDDKKLDFLHYMTPGGELRPLSLFGQLKREHFNQTDYRDLARTVFATLAKTSPYTLPVYEKAFATIKKYLKEMNDVTYDSKYEAWVAALSAWNTGVAAANVGGNAHPGADGINDIAGNVHRSLGMFVNGGPLINFGATQWALVPPTHGTYGGFKTIQQMYTSRNAAYFAVFSEAAAREIDEAMTVYDQFVSKVAAYFPKSLASSPTWVSPNVHTPSAADAIFENLLARQFASRALFIRPVQAANAANVVTQAAVVDGNGNTVTPATYGPSPFVAAINDVWNGARTYDELTNAFGVAVGTRPEAAEYDALFPTIQASLNALFKAVTGELEVLPAGADRRQTIGLNIGRGQGEINVREVPRATRSQKSQDLETALGAGAMTRLKLWMMTPAQTKNAASVKAKALLLLVFVDTGSYEAGDIATHREIANRYVAVLDRLDQTITNITTVTSANDLSRRYESQVQSIGSNIEKFIRNNKDLFIEAAGRSVSDAFKQIDIIRNNASINVPTGGTQHTLNDIQNFRPAPVRIGRAAYTTWISRDRYGESRFIPGSQRFAHMPLSQQEFTAESDANRRDNKGIWDDDYAQGGAADVENLPLVVNAKSRLSHSIGTPRPDSYMAPEYPVGSARRVSSGMPSITSQATVKRARYAGESYDSEMVGRSLSPAGNVMGGTPEFYTDNVSEELPSHMKKMFRQLCSEYDGELATQIVALLFMFTPVTRQALEATVNYNLLHPFDYIIARPHATYRTVASIKLKPGAETGNTIIGNIQVTVGDDTTVQVIQAHVRFYQGAIIYEPKNIYVVPNSMVVGYYRGLGSGFIDPDPSKYDPRIGMFGDTPDASIMVIPIPRHEKLTGKALSLSGQLTAVEATGRVNMLGQSPKRHSYNTNAFENRRWRFYMTRFNDYEYTVAGPGDVDIVPNTVVFSSLALYRDPKTGQWSAQTSNSGHWHTDTVGPGMHACRIAQRSFPLSSRPLAQSVFSF